MKTPSKERILVTGGYGFLGNHVCRELVRLGGKPFRYHSDQYDLRCEASAEALVRSVRPTILIHLAAFVGGIGLNAHQPDRMFRDNILMGAHLIHHAAACGVRRFIMTGTPCSYPADAEVPTLESALWKGRPVEVTAPYGVAKLALHSMLLAYQGTSGMESITIIPTNLYGPGDHYADNRSHVVAALINKFVRAVECKLPSVQVWGTGRASRDFLYVEDAARAIVSAVLVDESDPTPINAASGVATPIATLAGTIKRLTGYEGVIAWCPSMPDGYAKRALDITRAKELLGFCPSVSLEEGLAKTIEEYKREQQAAC